MDRHREGQAEDVAPDGNGTVVDSSRSRRNSIFIGCVSFAGACIVAAHGIAAWNPTGLNWGFHQLAFYSLPIRVVALFVMLSLLVPRVQCYVIDRLDQIITSWQHTSSQVRWMTFFIAVLVTAVVFWIGRERTFVLGDGNMIFRTLPLVHRVDDIPHFFQYEPLAGLLVWKASLFSTGSPEIPVQLLSIACGIVALIALGGLVRELSPRALDQVLIYLFIVVTGGSQLFFGYVEDYPSLYTGVIVYAWLAVAALRGKLHPVLPSMTLALLIALHFGSACLIPSLLVVWTASIQRKRWSEVVASAVGGLLTLTFLLWICRYSPSLMVDVFLKSLDNLLSLGSPSSLYQGYPLVSIWHLVDFVNAQLMLVPFALVMLVVALVWSLRRPRSTSLPWFFLLALAVGGIGFTLFFNFDLGMSRDWDLLVAFNVGIAIAAAYGWMEHVDRNIPAGRGILALAIGVTLIHSVAWIGINASAERGIARFQLLPDSRLWGKKSMLAAYEELAIYYRGMQDPTRSLDAYRSFLDIDSSNGRIWGGIAYVHRLMGDQAGDLYASQKAVRYGTPDWYPYYNLGLEKIARRQADSAIALLEKADSLHPGSAEVQHALGFTLLNEKGNFMDALSHFLRAIDLDPASVDSYLGAGLCYNNLRDTAAAKHYLEAFLRLAPESQNAPEIRAMLQSYR